jgi:predicted CoA-binding protein
MTPPFSTASADAAWRQHLIEDDAGIRALLERTNRIAVLGIKIAETRQPAYYVPEYAKRAGYEIVPVPVYYPEVTEILGERVYRTVAEIPGPIDMVNVFRRARHRCARRRHPRQATRVGLVPARHPQRRRGGALRARGDRRGPGPLPARGARRDRALSCAAMRRFSARP